MAELKHVKLSDSDVEEQLKTLTGWSLEAGQITKTYAFDAYLDGIIFASKVGHIAEDLDHHPDIHVYWRKVVLAVNSHDVKGISPYDFELARRVDAPTE